MLMSVSEPDRHTVELEERAMHQQRLLEKLSDVLFTQQRTIERLESRLERVESLLGELDVQVTGPLPHERPPHY